MWCNGYSFDVFCILHLLGVFSGHVYSHGQHFHWGMLFCYTVAPPLQLQSSELTQPVFLDLQKEIKPRKRGRRSGVRRRNIARKHKHYLPVIIMGNVQSLALLRYKKQTNKQIRRILQYGVKIWCFAYMYYDPIWTFSGTQTSLRLPPSAIIWL